MDTHYQTPSQERELTLTRIFEAPRERVWKTWTDPKQLAIWWAPQGMTTPVCEIDLRPGGKFRTVMRAPDGTEYPKASIYLEVTEFERLAFTDAYEEGWRPSKRPFMTVVITFEDQDNGTKFTARVRHWSVADCRTHEQMGFHEGWDKSADRLGAFLAKL